MLRTLLFCVGLGLVAQQTQAREFYVDPVNGSPGGDGSASRPWRTIQEVFDAGLVESQQWEKLPYGPQSKLVAKNAGAPVRPGDTIRLRSEPVKELHFGPWPCENLVAQSNGRRRPSIFTSRTDPQGC